MSSRKSISRRMFLGAAGGALAGGCAAGPQIVKPQVVGAGRKKAPSETLNIASIGAGGRAAADIVAVMDDSNLVAFSDVDEDRCAAMCRYMPDVPLYPDFRVMLEKEKSIDAVIVATPDHVHAIAAMTAMELGKHVYCEKPLTQTVYQARRLTEAARKYQVATQMGNQGHAGEGIRRVCEWIWADLIGPVHEVHVWTDRPIWPQGIDRPSETPPVRDTLSWDLWLGPAPERPYHPNYLPFNWRAWRDFGTGALGDMACHLMDPVFMALQLGAPETVEAESSSMNGETFPEWSIVTFQFPARRDMPPVKVFWYDGGKKPSVPEAIRGAKLGDLEEEGANGSLFIGEKGYLTAGTYGASPRLLPAEKMEELEPNMWQYEFLPRSPGHHAEWIAACKGGKPAGSNFDYAGPMTEAVLLGNVALCTGEKIEWNAKKVRVTNIDEANALINPPARKGWAI
ncbi:MAG: Gfo/Idh/MocA family oxidoreductase [Nitrospiraceae bacterium]|nr:Gfo/Idh/MocA family oxidoreductase [Nitrospiraceae bacterium]